MLWEILKASKGILVADLYADLWANIAGGGTPVDVFVEMIGTLPLYYYGKGIDLADFLISGNTVQDGTPSADAPVDAVGCGVRTGNLVRFYQEEMQGEFYGVDIAVKNAEITLNGSVTAGSEHWIEIGYKFGGGTSPTDNVIIPCESETPYTIAIEVLGGTSSEVRPIAFGTADGNKSIDIGSSLTTIFGSDINRIFISLGAEGVIFNNLKVRVMFNKGSTALPYEPYGSKLPLAVNGVEYPIYLGQVETTRRIKKLVLTGQEDIPNNDGTSYNSTFSTDRFVRGIDKTLENNGTDNVIVCTHITFYAQVWAATNRTGCCIYCYRNKMQLHLRFDNETLGIEQTDTNEERTAKLKSYLAAQYAAGTPVTVWYVLATHETSIVNEPLMKIGNYADTISFAQAGVTIPTVSGANVLDMTSPVKPSEVYIKGKGIKPTQGGN